MIYDDEIVMIPGVEGELESIVSLSDPTVKKTAIICHPHPLHGGTMNNKVVYTLAKAFAELGMGTVRFNYRGVGNSAGTYAEGIGETEDALAVIKWVKTQLTEVDIILAGFSFGGYVAARAATLYPAERLVTVAPGVEHFDFTKLPPITCPWLVVQGEADEIVPPEKVYELVRDYHPHPTLARMPEVTHFFHGHLMELKKIIVDELHEPKK